MFKKVLIANRGEIALRIARAACELGIHTVAVFTSEDTNALHVIRASEAHGLPKHGAAGYLNIDDLVDIARRTSCDCVHPGYGFLSENPEFARRCRDAGLAFIGPSVEVLESLGQKDIARQIAIRAGVPVARGTKGAAAFEDVRAFMTELGADKPIIIKSVSGGGGRGMRVVHAADELRDAFERAASEAKGAFNSEALYAEELIAPARHVEVQILGDISGNVVHALDRECSIQRRHQKLIEIAPAPGISERTRKKILEAAVAIARECKVHTLCTMEFLVEATGRDDARFVFMEANPRLQVEHTVTEEILGIDLVQAQFRLAAGDSLSDIGLSQDELSRPRGVAVQIRINMERVNPDGTTIPSGGELQRFDPPSGAGIRIESSGYPGYRTTTAFDSLLAKLIAHVPNGSLKEALARAYRATCEFNIVGVNTNLALLQALVTNPDVQAGKFDTQFFERNLHALIAQSEHPRLFLAAQTAEGAALQSPEAVAPEGTVPVTSDLAGLVVAVLVAEGDVVAKGAPVAIIEAMKMEYEIKAALSGKVRSVLAATGHATQAGSPLAFIEPGDFDAASEKTEATQDPSIIRADLEKVLARIAEVQDAGRPEAVAKRHKYNLRTARENIEDLCDSGSFVEYGALNVAAQRKRYSFEELRKISPSDGLITGFGTVNGQYFDADRARCAVMAYDYTVFAGTQGFVSFKKFDRLSTLAREFKIPVVAFAEGGGGRPAETDYGGAYGMDIPSYRLFAELSGHVPVISIVAGRCFAGNAALPACSDVVIATRDANLGMAGPALIEGGGLGQFRPQDIGPMSDLAPVGSVDIVVKDEEEATFIAKKYLSYFQGALLHWSCDDQNLLRHAIPENRMRAYDVRRVIEILADHGSVLELRPQSGVGMITAFVRIEGRPIGLIANNPMHLGGAIDGEAANKGARMLELCDAFNIPIVGLQDTAGFMVGPDEEKKGLLNKVGRFFMAGANLSVPYLSITLRKGYGLGAMAMTAGGFSSTALTVSWPTAEFGGMGIEGEVKLGFRKHLQAISDPVEREAEFKRLVAEHYELGSALSMASYGEIDAIIDPADTRKTIINTLNAVGNVRRPNRKRLPFIHR